MKNAPPDQGGAHLLIETEPPRYTTAPPVFQVFIGRPAAMAYVIAFVVATWFVAHVDRGIALRQIGRST